MPLTEEQVKSIKGQILKQINNFPPEQQETAKEQIESMDAEQLEQFLIQNKLIKNNGSAEEIDIEGQQGCIFCSIVEGKTPSHRIDENKSSIAILDINPLTKGHSLVIPKRHLTIEKLPSSILGLAKRIAKRIKAKLKPQEVKIETSSIQGHGIVSIIPFYKDAKPERKKAKEEELFSIQALLKSKTRAKRAKKKEIKSLDLPLAPIRIP